MLSLLTVFYDGDCGLCHRMVRLLAHIDRDRALRFAPLHGVTFNLLALPEAQAKDLPDSLVVCDRERLLTRSDAVIAALQAVGGIWKGLANITKRVPRDYRDRAYDVIARRRKHWFAAPTQTCPVGSPELRSRFLA